MKKIEKLSIKEIKKSPEARGRCPFIKKSFRECYCMDMNSLRTDDAIYYCGLNFTQCPIYKEKSALISLGPDNAVNQKKEAKKQ